MDNNWFQRLVDHLPGAIMLSAQSSQVPQLSKLTNALTYGDQVKNEPSTYVANRPLAQMFQKAVSEFYGIPNRSYVVVNGHIDSESTGTVSPYNDANIKTGVAAAVKLVHSGAPQSSLQIRTPFRDQIARYKRSLQEKDQDNIAVLDFVGLDDNEVDFVIIDFVVTRKCNIRNHAARNAAHLHAIIKRVKNGLIVIGNVTSAEMKITPGEQPEYFDYIFQNALEGGYLVAQSAKSNAEKAARTRSVPNSANEAPASAKAADYQGTKNDDTTAHAGNTPCPQQCNKCIKPDHATVHRPLAKCTKCQAVGHLCEVCPKKDNCSYCGKPGHKAHSCGKKRRERAKAKKPTFIPDRTTGKKDGGSWTGGSAESPMGNLIDVCGEDSAKARRAH